MGSSLRVTPAASMPQLVGDSKRGRLVIVNLQSTPLDDVAAMRINAKTDDVMVALMEKLEIPIPQFYLRRIIGVRIREKVDGVFTARITGYDSNKQRMSLFKALRYNGTTKKLSERETSRFRLQLPKELNSKDKLDKHTITVYLGFNGHYNEPPLKFGHTICAGAQDLEVLDNEVFYVVTFDPISKEWKSQDVLEDDVEENKENDAPSWRDSISNQITNAFSNVAIGLGLGEPSARGADSDRDSDEDSDNELPDHDIEV